MVTQHRDGGQRRQAGCRAARWQLRPTGVPWRCLRGGAVEVAPPWSAVASAPPPAATAPCTLEGQHTNRERRRRASEGAPGLLLPSTGGAWRCLRQGAVRVAPPLPVGATLRTRHRTCSYPLLAGRHANGERYVGGCRVVSWLPHPHTGVLWRCLRGGVVEVAPPWSAVASAPPYLLHVSRSLTGRHPDGSARQRGTAAAGGWEGARLAGPVHRGCMEVPPLGSGEGGAPVASRSHPCSIRTPSVLLLSLLLLAGRHANGERRVCGCMVVSRLPLPSTGVLWRCLRGGVVEVAPPWSAVASAPSYPATAPYCTAGGAARQRGTAAAGGWEGARLAGPVHRGCMEVPRRRSGGAGSPAAGLEHCIY